MSRFEELLTRYPLPNAHDGSKDDKGHALLIGGPATCPGAIVLAANAALRMGVGRVQVAVDPAVAATIGVAVPEVAVFAWNQKASPPPELVPRLRDADVVVIGPGHQVLDEIVVRSTAERARGTVILDAGALPSTLAVARSARTLIAPNPTEAARLLDREGDEEVLARALAERIAAPVAVRGATTVIVDGDDCFTFDDSPPGLGTPGSGDVFIGVLAALVAGGCPAAASLGWATYLHAAAGRVLSASTPVGYLARDVIEQLPRVRASAAGS